MFKTTAQILKENPDAVKIRKIHNLAKKPWRRNYKKKNELIPGSYAEEYIRAEKYYYDCLRDQFIDSHRYQYISVAPNGEVIFIIFILVNIIIIIVCSLCHCRNFHNSLDIFGFLVSFV